MKHPSNSARVLTLILLILWNHTWVSQRSSEKELEEVHHKAGEAMVQNSDRFVNKGRKGECRMMSILGLKTFSFRYVIIQLNEYESGIDIYIHIEHLSQQYGNNE